MCRYSKTRNIEYKTIEHLLQLNSVSNRTLFDFQCSVRFGFSFRQIGLLHPDVTKPVHTIEHANLFETPFNYRKCSIVL